NLAREKRVQGPLHVPRCQGLAIVKAHTLMKMKYVSLRIGNLPRFRQPWLQFKMFVTPDQRIKDQFANSFRLGVNSDPWIQVGGTALYDHHQRVGVRLVSA